MGEDHYSQWQDNTTFLEKMLTEGISILSGKKKITNSSKDTEDLNKVRDTLCYRTRRLNIMKMYIVPIFTILKFFKIYLFLIGG